MARFFKRRTYAKRRRSSRTSNPRIAANRKRKMSYKGRGIRHRRKRVKSIRVSAPGLSTATTYFKGYTNKYARLLNKKYGTCQRNMYFYEGVNQITTSYGRQAASESTTLTATDLLQCATMVGLQGGSTGNAGNTSKLFIVDSKMTHTFNNCSNTPVFLDLYHYICKKDTSNNVFTCWNLGMKDESGQTAADFTATVGTTPHMANAVMDYYKLKKIYHIVLQPGQVHQHYSNFPVHRIIDMEMLRTAMNNNTYYAGITNNILMTVRGSPMHDTGVGAITTTTPPNVMVSSQMKITFKYMADYDTNWKFDGIALNTTNSGTIYNQGSGAGATAVVML